MNSVNTRPQQVGNSQIVPNQQPGQLNFNQGQIRPFGPSQNSSAKYEYSKRWTKMKVPRPSTANGKKKIQEMDQDYRHHIYNGPVGALNAEDEDYRVTGAHDNRGWDNYEEAEYPEESWDGGDNGNYDESYNGYEEVITTSQTIIMTTETEKDLGMKVQVLPEEWDQEWEELGVEETCEEGGDLKL
ncbi:hypothetical protein Btru_054648 [Bulinus truncatus]|nr:hypothetical protein Btru_054648 [Bulinus truncatus]